jgi:hypothetical protein
VPTSASTVKFVDFAKYSTLKKPVSAYQSLETIFRQSLNNEQSQRFSFESQLKALADFQYLHSHLYAEISTRQLVERATTDFLTHVQKWHENHFISSTELNFSLETVQTIRKSLEAAKAKQLTSQEKATSLPPINYLTAQTTVISNPLSLPYTDLKTVDLENPIPETTLYVAPMVFSEVSGKYMHSELVYLSTRMRLANEHGQYDNAIASVHSFIKQIPILDKSFWEALSSSGQDTHDLIKLLRDVSNEYYWSLIKRPTTDAHHPLGDNIPKEDYFVQIKLLKIVDKLLKMKPLHFPFSDSLKERDIPEVSIPLYIPIFTPIFEGQLPHFQAPTPEWAKELQAIKHDWYTTEPDKLDRKNAYDPRPWGDGTNQPRATFFLHYSRYTPYPRNLSDLASLFRLYSFDTSGQRLTNSLIQPIYSFFSERGIEKFLSQNLMDKLIEASILTDGMHTVAGFLKNQDDNTGYIPETAIPSEEISLPDTFYALRDIVITTNLMLHKKTHAYWFTKGIKWDCLNWLSRKGDLVSHYTLNVFGDTVYHLNTDITNPNYVQKTTTALDGYLYGRGGLDAFTGGQARVRIPLAILADEVLQRRDDGDKNSPEFILQMLTLSSVMELQATQSLSFYRQNLHLLKDADHRHIFRFLLLEPGVLEAELSKHPRDNEQFIETLVAFLKKSHATYASIGDTNTASFFLILSQEIASHIKPLREDYKNKMQQWTLDLDKPEFFELHPDAEREMVSMLQIDGLDRMTAVNTIYSHSNWIKDCQQRIEDQEKIVSDAGEILGDYNAHIEKVKRWSDLDSEKWDLELATQQCDEISKEISALQNDIKQNQESLNKAEADISSLEGRYSRFLLAASTLANRELISKQEDVDLAKKSYAKLDLTNKNFLYNPLKGELELALNNWQAAERAKATILNNIISLKKEIGDSEIGDSWLLQRIFRAHAKIYSNINLQKTNIYLQEDRRALANRKKEREFLKHSIQKDSLTLAFAQSRLLMWKRRLELNKELKKGKINFTATEEDYKKSEKKLFDKSKEKQEEVRINFEKAKIQLGEFQKELELTQSFLQKDLTTPNLHSYKESIRNERSDMFPKGYQLPFMDASKEFHRLLAKPDLPLETVAFLYSQLALSYVTQKDLSAAQVEDLLHAVIASGLYAHPKGSLNQADKVKLKYVLIEKQNEIRPLFEKDANSLLNKVYQHFHKEASDLQWKGQFRVQLKV